MKDTTAYAIASEFIKEMNPDNWDGIGERPDTFNLKIKTFDIGIDGIILDISFDYDVEDREWTHYCEVRDKSSGELMTPMHGYGVNDIQNLTTTILDVTTGYEEV